MKIPIFDGGPLDRLLDRLGLGGYSQAQIHRRVLFWVGITWAPLVILAGIASFSSSLSPKVTFLKDFTVHIRLLVALPIVVFAERYVYLFVSEIIPIFLEREMIRSADEPALKKTESWIGFFRDSTLIELALLFFSVWLAYRHPPMDLPQEVSSWRNQETTMFRLASGWNEWFCLVLYQFLLFRWVWRYFLWSLFLFRLSSLKLDLQSHHADQVGGLSFVTMRHLKFGLVVLAISCVASSNIAERVIYGGENVDFFQAPLMTYIVTVIFIFLIPLLVFTPLLARTKREGLHRYGNFSARYARRFDEKWLTVGRSAVLDPLGAPDIQSLNDLDGSYEHLRGMRLVLVGQKQFMSLMVFTVAPFIPLVFFKIPILELFKVLVKALI